jgi:diadenosine tetraphosphate (Ap4A) HIT family hydrolase
MTFALHPRLAAGSHIVVDLSLCRVLIKDDRRWPWLILVPRREDKRELHHLTEGDGAVLMAEIRRASLAVGDLDGVAKVNVGALGNEVAQLHIHVVGRWPGDPAWPGPVWGAAGKTPYNQAQARDLADALRVRLQSGDRDLL